MFEVQGDHVRQASGMELLTFAPLVAEEARKDWEDYAWKHQGWIKESRNVRFSSLASSMTGGASEEALYHLRNQYYDTDISPILYEHESIEPPFVQIPAVEAPFLPAWHVRLMADRSFSSLLPSPLTSAVFSLRYNLNFC